MPITRLNRSREGGRKGGKPPAFVEWVWDVYRDQLGLPEVEGSARFREFLASADFAALPISSALKRVQSFHIVKFGYPLRRAGYTVAVFTAQTFEPGSRSRKNEAYFAYAYWPCVPGQEDVETAEPEYVCLSPAFESRDGEYRHRFLWYPQFAEGYASLLDPLSKIEQLLLDAVAADELGVDVVVFPGTPSLKKGACPAAAIEAHRLGVKFLAATLASAVVQSRDSTFPVHTNPAYVAVLGALYTRDPGLFDAWGGAEARKAEAFTAGKAGQPNRPQCGQKLVPLTVREALQVGDARFAPWREEWVGRAATDLVVNGVAPMFPIFGNWTYLEGVGQDLFENKAMHEKYRRSLRGEAAARELRDARRLAAEGFPDYRMEQFDAHIYDALLYAQEYVQLTDLALCTVAEYVGPTVATVPVIIRNSTSVSPAFFEIYSDPARTARYLFDLCYGAHVLHTRVGAIHSDLHLNNMTIFPDVSIRRGESGVAGQPFVYRPLISDPRIAYVAGGRGEAETYVFPHDGWFACIIDFSRALLGPAARERLAEQHGEAFVTSFFRGQVSRALRTLHHYAPSLAEKHQEEIKAALLATPDQVFRVLTAVDFLAVGRNFGAHLRQLAEAPPQPGDKHKIVVAPGGIAVAEAVEQQALHHLVVYLTDLLDPAALSRPGGRAGIPFAGETILPGAFGDFLYARQAAGLRDATLADVYNAAAPLTYSGSDYGRYPPWARLDQIEEHLGGMMKDASFADRGVRPFLQTLGLDSYFNLLVERVREGVADQPAAATSSWLAD